MSKQNLKSKKDFEKWMQDSITYILPEVPDSSINAVFTNIGINNISIYDEIEELRIRLYVSELIMKREKCGLDNPNEYLAIVHRLLCYAEYLGCKGKAIETSKEVEKTVGQGEMEIAELKERDKLSDSLIIAYYLSRINTDAVKELGYNSFRAAFDGLAKILGQKPSTIKNMRDEFDPYFNNGRAGWYQREMSPSRRTVFEQLANVSDKELTKIVKEIITAYTLAGNNGSMAHKRIKIISRDMKEIRSRKK